MFERKSMEQIVNDMIRWTRGVTTKITDFRVGSKTRTLYEAVAVQIEQLYDRVYRSMKKLIEENIYTVIGFSKLEPTFASGMVRLSRMEIATMNYLIPSGTVVLSRATQTRAPLRYLTFEDVILEEGKTSVDVRVVCDEPGEQGNIGVGEIIDFLTKPAGVDYVINVEPMAGGREEETKEAQKLRFQEFIEANTRGVVQSIEYGAKTVALVGEDGVEVEKVLQSIAIEGTGYVDLYIWNGTGTASEALKQEVDRVMMGYYDEDGNPIYGYKPAGIPVNVHSAIVRLVKVNIEAVIHEWAIPNKAQIDDMLRTEVNNYFRNLRMSDTVFYSTIVARAKRIEGMKDVLVTMSLEGAPYSRDNLHTEKFEICVPEEVTINSIIQ